MMLVKPGGLWPSSIVQRELHLDVKNDPGPNNAPTSAD